MQPKNMQSKNHTLYIGQYALDELARCFGTPLYVYDEKHLRMQMQTYHTFFKSKYFDTTVVYASKAFFVPQLCNMLMEEELWMDAVSIGDLYIAHTAGFPMEHIVFHGNNKSLEELQYAVTHEVGLIVVDNLYELELLEQVAKRCKKTVKTLFRLNPGIDTHTHQYIQTALYVSKFGESIYDLDKVEQIIHRYLQYEKVSLLGFHVHIGSQIKEMDPFLLSIEKMVHFSKAMEEKYQITLPWLNLGGGFGINYVATDQVPDAAVFLMKIIKKVERTCKTTKYHLERLFIEPGRSIVGTAGVTLYSCGIVKQTFGGKNYLFIDGGMTDNIRPALYQAEYSVDVVNKMNEAKTLLVDVAGKCCESGDVIAKGVMIPPVSVGDILVVYATGAYTYAMSSNYNSMLKPAVVFVGDEVTVVSKRETLADLNRYFTSK